jgi:hypothetical protein
MCRWRENGDADSAAPHYQRKRPRDGGVKKTHSGPQFVLQLTSGDADCGGR